MNMQRHLRSKGFTLLELLVVVAIIGILAAAIYASFSAPRARSRDAKRVGEIKQLQNALSLYYASNNIFPTCATTDVPGTVGGSSGCVNLDNVVSQGHIPQLPRDPAQASVIASTDCNDIAKYLYCYGSTNGSTYKLYFHVETGSLLGYSSPGWYSVSP